MIRVNRRDILSVGAIVVAALVCYFNCLDNSFLRMDDYGLVVENSYIRYLRNIPASFTSFHRGVYRPLREISYTLDYYLFGVNPAGYHFTNLLLHIFNAILLYFIVNSALRRQTVSLFTALLFTVHPVLTEPVTWISCRKDVLFTFFFLLSLFLYTHQTGRRKKLYYFGSFISFLLSLLAKEMAITLPLILVLYDYCFKPERRKQTLIYKVKRYYWPFFLVALLCGLAFLPLSSAQQRPYEQYGGRYLLLLTMPRVVLHYIKLLFFPIKLCPAYMFPISHSLFELPVLASTGLLLCLFIFMIRIYRYSKPIFFSLWWFFITLIPASNLIVALNNPVAERHLYLPSIGFSLLVALVFGRMSKLKPDDTGNYIIRTGVVRERMALGWLSADFFRKVATILFILVLILYSLRTILRNNDWQEDLTLWSKTAEDFPNHWLAHYNVGNEYQRMGKLDEAIGKYKTALSIRPNYADAHNNLGIVYAAKGRDNEAISEFKKAIDLGRVGVVSQAHYNLGLTYHGQERLAEAIHEYKKALTLKPGFAEARLQLAEAQYALGFDYYSKGMLDEAVREYKAAIKTKPDYLDPHNGLGVIYAKRGMVKESIAEFREVLESDSGNEIARHNLELIMREASHD